MLYMLIPIMLFQSNMALIISVSFYHNQTFIAKYLCVQRSINNNSCQGQCYLMRKIQAQQEQEQANFKVNLQEALLIQAQQNTLASPILPALQKADYLPFRNKLFPKEPIQSLFRPPLSA